MTLNITVCSLHALSACSVEHLQMHVPVMRAAFHADIFFFFLLFIVSTSLKVFVSKSPKLGSPSPIVHDGIQILVSQFSLLLF